MDHAEKTLGVYISMDGNEDAELDYLLSMSKTFGSQMKTTKCTKNIALYTYNSSFLKSIEYSMAITQFSEQEWIKIMSPALGPTLQKAGISKNAPRSAL